VESTVVTTGSALEPEKVWPVDSVYWEGTALVMAESPLQYWSRWATKYEFTRQRWPRRSCHDFEWKRGQVELIVFNQTSRPCERQVWRYNIRHAWCHQVATSPYKYEMSIMGHTLEMALDRSDQSRSDSV